MLTFYYHINYHISMKSKCEQVTKQKTILKGYFNGQLQTDPSAHTELAARSTNRNLNGCLG